MANQSSRPLSIANLEDALRISPPVAQPSPVNSRPASLFGGSTPPARPGNGLGSMPLGGAGLGGSVHHPRPVSEAFATYEAEQLDRWFDELGHYERTLEAMSRAKRDDNFREELRAIEQWFTVLSDAERVAALHALLGHANYVQIRFLMTVLQKMLKEAEKDPVRPPVVRDGPGPIGNGRYRQRLFDRHSAPNVEEQYYRYLANLDAAAAANGGPSNPTTRPSSIHDRPASIHERSSIHERPPSYHERPSSYHELQRPPSIHDPIPSGSGGSRPPSFHETSNRPLSFHESTLNRPLSFHERHDRPASFHEASLGLGLGPAPSQQQQQQQLLSSSIFDDQATPRRHSTVSLYGSRIRGQPSGGPGADLQAPFPIKLDPLPENVEGYRRSPVDPSSSRFDDVWGGGVYNLRERLIGGLRDRTGRLGGNSSSSTYQSSSSFGGLGLGYDEPLSAGSASSGPPGFADWTRDEIPQPSTSPRPVSVPSSPIWRPPSGNSPARGSAAANMLGTINNNGKVFEAQANASMGAAGAVGLVGVQGEDEEPKGGFKAEHVEVEQLQDIPSWLRSLRLHKYTSLFENVSWKDMIKLTDEELEAKGVSAMGARKKLLRVFSLIKQGVEEKEGYGNDGPAGAGGAIDGQANLASAQAQAQA